MTIPLLAMVFGYMTYLILSSGLIAQNGSSETRAFSIMFVCFLAGFLTKWLISWLSRMSRDI